jgi:hypothetical protein
MMALLGARDTSRGETSQTAGWAAIRSMGGWTAAPAKSDGEGRVMVVVGTSPPAASSQQPATSSINDLGLPWLARAAVGLSSGSARAMFGA